MSDPLLEKWMSGDVGIFGSDLSRLVVIENTSHLRFSAGCQSQSMVGAPGMLRPWLNVVGWQLPISQGFFKNSTEQFISEVTSSHF